MSKKDDINIHYNSEEDNPSIVDTNKQINSNIQMLSTANKNEKVPEINLEKTSI